MCPWNCDGAENGVDDQQSEERKERSHSQEAGDKVRDLSLGASLRERIQASRRSSLKRVIKSLDSLMDMDIIYFFFRCKEWVPIKAFSN